MIVRTTNILIALAGLGLAQIAQAQLVTAVPPAARSCATDGQRCNVTGSWSGVYGANGRFAVISGSGAFTCLPGDLKVADPAPNVQKTCYVVASAASTAASPAPASTPAASPAPASTPAAAKPFTTGAEARWTKLFLAVEKLVKEGQEVGRITPAEDKAIQDYIQKGRAFIAAKKKDGKFTEAEEDSVDSGNAGLLASVAKSMSDTQRKAAATTPAAAKAATPAAATAATAAAKPFTAGAEKRWTKLFQAVEKLAKEGQEVGRITPAEDKAIQDYIQKGRAFIAAKKKDGKFTEAEEDSVDSGNAGLLASVAKAMSATK